MQWPIRKRAADRNFRSFSVTRFISGEFDDWSVSVMSTATEPAPPWCFPLRDVTNESAQDLWRMSYLKPQVITL